MNKVYPDARSALDGLLHDGMLIAAAFPLAGRPLTLALPTLPSRRGARG